MCATKMVINLLSMIILIQTLLSSIKGNGETRTESYMYDVYPGLKINSGLLLENFESGLMNQDHARVLCLFKCNQDPNCSMVTLEKISHFTCSFWKFNETHDVSPSFNVNSTLYTKDNCEYILYFAI